MAASGNPLARLEHVRDELAQLAEALVDVDFEAFVESYVLRRTTEHALLIVSEAVRALPREMTDRHPGIEWSDIRVIGNVLRHEYFSVDPRILWDTVTRHLPALAPIIDRMIAECPR